MTMRSDAFIMLLGMMLILTGCTSSRFDCPSAAGISCQSLDQINRQIDAGALPLLAFTAQGGVLC